jgi:ubiquinone/menaquinone biosynthesis C-methylase UbiE
MDLSHYTDLVKALADPTRLRIVALLEDAELTVNEITDVLGMGQSRISRHLKILADCGFLKFRRDGLWTFYVTMKEGGAYSMMLPLLKSIKECSESLSDKKKAGQTIRDRAKKMIGYFNTVARDWDIHRAEMIGSFDINAEIISYIEKGPVADLGCGNGSLSISLARNGFEVIGVDSSPKMIESAKKHAAAMENAHFRIGELEHLPLRDNEAASSVAVLVMHHLSNPERAFCECARIVLKGGVVIIVDFDKHRIEKMRDKHHDMWLGFSRKEREEWTAAAGLTIQSEKRVKLESGLSLIFTKAIK